MSQIIGFTRKETMELTDCTSGRLAYLEQIWQIKPCRYGGISGGNPIVLFSWEQLVEIRAIEYLRRESIPLEMVRKILEFLRNGGYNEILKKKQLISMDDCVFWVELDWSNFADNVPASLKVANEENKTVRRYNLFVIPSLIFILEDIWEVAEDSRKIDFPSFRERAVALPN